MSDLIPLSCFIWGSSPLDEGLFPVKIPQNESLGVLKADILNSNPITFQGVDARTLQLWKVSRLFNVR